MVFPRAKTTADLLSAVRTDAMLPTADGRITTSDILDLASQELSTTIADLLVALRQERWVQRFDDQAVTSGQGSYVLPSRALAAGVADVLLVDSDGTEYDVPEVSAEDRYAYSNGNGGNWRSPYAYTWEGDQIILVPMPTETRYTLRVRYPLQPSRLVETTQCATVATVNATTVTTQANVPSWTIFTGSIYLVDFVAGHQPGDVREATVAITHNGTTTITRSSPGSFATTGGRAIRYLDYVSQAGMTCVPPVPESVYPVLVAATTRRVLEAIGDNEALPATERAYQRAEQRARNVLAPRNRGGRELVTNPHSALRAGRFPGWR